MRRKPERLLDVDRVEREAATKELVHVGTETCPWRMRLLLLRNRFGNAWLAFRYGLEACDGCGVAHGSRALADARDECVNLAADLYSSLKERDRLRQSLEVAQDEIAELRAFLAAVGWTEAK